MLNNSSSLESKVSSLPKVIKNLSQSLPSC